MNPSFTRTTITLSMSVLIALIAFAANSVLCRLALDPGYDVPVIDASTFTILRLSSGALILFLLFQIKQFNTRRSQRKTNISPLDTSTSNRINPLSFSTKHGSWSGTFSLFIYALFFSYAYIELETGVGALVLFGAVQITMIIASVLAGQKLHFSELTGLAIAFSGFIYLVSPGLSAPPLVGFLLMSLSGVAWAIYSLIGRNSISPFDDTTFNFLRTLPLLAVVLLLSIDGIHLTSKGALLAILSGTLASGAGYSIWYLALRSLSRTQAGVLQLLVPVFAALGGVIFVGEVITLRLFISFNIVIFGVLIVLFGQKIAQ